MKFWTSPEIRRKGGLQGIRGAWKDTVAAKKDKKKSLIDYNTIIIIEKIIIIGMVITKVFACKSLFPSK